MSMRRCLAHLLLLIGLTVGSSTTNAAVNFSNPPDYPGAYNSLTSQNDSGINFPQYSPFTLSSAGNITAATWQGLYVSNVLANNPPSPDSSSFTLSIYNDVGGVPGSAVSSNTINVGLAAGDVHETFNSFDNNFFLGGVTLTSAALYDYAVNLPSPVTLSGSTPYWFSVVANTTNGFATPFWGWNSGGTTNGPTYNPFFTDPLARTFSLTESSSVPEPASFLVWGALGLLGVCIAAVRYRRIAL